MQSCDSKKESTQWWAKPLGSDIKNLAKLQQECGNSLAQFRGDYFLLFVCEGKPKLEKYRAEYSTLLELTDEVVGSHTRPKILRILSRNTDEESLNLNYEAEMA